MSGSDSTGRPRFFVKQQPRQMTLPGSNTRECQEHFPLQRLSQSSANLQRSKMDPTAAITLVINNNRVVAHFTTNLATTNLASFRCVRQKSWDYLSAQCLARIHHLPTQQHPECSPFKERRVWRWRVRHRIRRPRQRDK